MNVFRKIFRHKAPSLEERFPDIIVGTVMEVEAVSSDPYAAITLKAHYYKEELASQTSQPRSPLFYKNEKGSFFRISIDRFDTYGNTPACGERMTIWQGTTGAFLYEMFGGHLYDVRPEYDCDYELSKSTRKHLDTYKKVFGCKTKKQSMNTREELSNQLNFLGYRFKEKLEVGDYRDGINLKRSWYEKELFDMTGILPLADTDKIR